MNRFKIINIYKEKTVDTFGIMSLKEFAKAINKPESTVRTWRQRGEIPEHCFKVIGGTVFVRVQEIQAFLAA